MGQKPGQIVADNSQLRIKTPSLLQVFASDVVIPFRPFSVAKHKMERRRAAFLAADLLNRDSTAHRLHRARKLGNYGPTSPTK